LRAPPLSSFLRPKISSELEYYLPLARDLQFLQAALYEKLAADTIVIERMR